METLENFGSVGEEPSHPELLDWLALHFQNDLHWDMKALLRELVTSATYRQSAVTTPALTEKRSSQSASGTRTATETYGGNGPRPGFSRQWIVESARWAARP